MTSLGIDSGLSDKNFELCFNEFRDDINDYNEMFEEINTKLDNHINSKDGQLLEIRDILKEQNKKIDPLYEVLVAGRGAKTIAYIVTTLAALTASIIYLKNVLWTK